MDDLTVYNIAVDLLECIRAELEAAELPIPCRICFVPGSELAWDSCEGGSLTALSPQDFESEEFPLDASGARINPNCTPGLVVAELQIDLLRCVTIPSGMSLTVPCETLAEEGKLIMRDAYHMRRALNCCLREMKQGFIIHDYIVAAITRQGPEGKCAGNQARVLIGLVNG